MRASNKKEKEEKYWNNLPILSRNVFLIMQARYFTGNDPVSDDDDEIFFILYGPMEHIKAILNCSMGARVQQYLHYVMKKNKCIVEVGLGMGTAIKNGMIGSQPLEQEVKNFSPFFCTIYNESDRMTAAKL